MPYINVMPDIPWYMNIKRGDRNWEEKRHSQQYPLFPRSKGSVWEHTETRTRDYGFESREKYRIKVHQTTLRS